MAPARTAARLDGIPPTIFSTMSALAVRTGAVNLGQGFPDVDGPPEVIAAAVAALAPQPPTPVVRVWPWLIWIPTSPVTSTPGAA